MRSSAPFARAILPARRLLAVLLLAGCSGGPEPTDTTTAITEDSQLLASVHVDKHAITLSTTAPYDTAQLSVVSLALNGDTLQGLPAPTFVSNNERVVQVTSDGMIQAVGTGDAKVTARVTLPGNISQTDVATVTVVNNPMPPRLAHISIHPVPPDSAVRPVLFEPIHGVPILPNVEAFTNLNVFPVFSATDSNGNPVSNLQVSLETLDPTVALISTQAGGVDILYVFRSDLFPSGLQTQLVLMHPGQARIVAQVTAYGVTIADTVTWNITWPTVGSFKFTMTPDSVASLYNTERRIAPGGFIEWQALGYDVSSDTTDTVAVVFDDPTNVAMPTPDICAAYDAYNDFFAAFQGKKFYKPGSQCQAGNFDLPHDPLSTQQSRPFATDLDYQVRTRQFFVPGVYRFHTTRKHTGQSLGDGTIIVTTNPNAEFP